MVTRSFKAIHPEVVEIFQAGPEMNESPTSSVVITFDFKCFSHFMVWSHNHRWKESRCQLNVWREKLKYNNGHYIQSSLWCRSQNCRRSRYKLSSFKKTSPTPLQQPTCLKTPQRLGSFFTTLKFRSPALNCGGCTFKEVISFNNDPHLLLLLSCYDGSPLLSTLVCQLQSHRSFTRTPAASGCISVCYYPRDLGFLFCEFMAVLISGESEKRLTPRNRPRCLQG